MTLLTFKQKLYTTLKSHYPETEIASFFKIILEDVLQLSKIDFALHPQQHLTDAQATKINTIILKLSEQQPIQQLIGFVTYMDLKLTINEHVLIPRPETEELIHWIVSDNTTNTSIDILDIGTGTGCIPIALAKNLHKAQVSSVDVSPKAIETAKQNAKQNGAKVNFSIQNILTTTALNNTYDVIVSNPPYIRNLEKVEIKQNVLEYEPHLALFVADDDPLIFYRKIAELALQALKPNGALYYEINQYLGNETVALLKQIGFKQVTLRKDIFGNDRMIKATL